MSVPNTNDITVDMLINEYFLRQKQSYIRFAVKKLQHYLVIKNKLAMYYSEDITNLESVMYLCAKNEYKVTEEDFKKFVECMTQEQRNIVGF